jgi:hypothetical protein
MEGDGLSPGGKMLRKIAIGLTGLAAMLLPASADAATVSVELVNHAFQPLTVLALSGDTVVLHNSGTRKVIQSFTDNQLPPTTVENGQTISFAFNGTQVGLRGDDLDPQTPPLSSVDANGNCTGMCGRVTATPPANSPQTPTFATPANAATVGANVFFSGSAVNAAKVRVKIGSLIRIANVDGGGAWSFNQAFTNGSYTATAVAVHPEGFESGSASVTFTVDAGDTAPPQVLAGNPAKVLGQPTQLRAGSYFIGHGPLDINGVIVDDVSAKKVVVTVRDAEIPDTTVTVTLTCFVPGGNGIPCDSASNPQRIQYRGTHLPSRPGHYVVTTTATDGAGRQSVLVQDVIVLSHV